MNKQTSLTIGRLAKSAGVNVETVRFYERQGLIKKPTKSRGAFRVYSEDDAVRIRFVKKAQNLGFTLSEINALFKLEKNSKISCAQLKVRVQQKVQELDEKMTDLSRMKESLVQLCSACDEGAKSVQQCRISECFEGQCCR